jgi:trehalose 6-phosphate synthase
LRVNRTFAQALVPLLSPDDLVWVHDYHLIPLAAELRRADQRQAIGFFLHTPFPAADLLRVLPNHQEIARMLCAYDLVGFQTAPDLVAFRDYLLRWAGAQDLGPEAVRAFGRIVRTRVFPIGIDVEAVAAQAEAAQENRHMRRLRQSLGERALMIGVDRLDYSKGLGARFECYRQLLELYPETRGRIVFMQIAPPSRSEVPEYQVIRKSLETAAGAINSRYGEYDWTPLRYINKSFHHRILTGFFRASRIALVTPQRDGMNLVAKEYVASQRPEDPGVLVLSCFAGAARELGDAIIVNPYDVEGMTEAILYGLKMPQGERRERWSAMMQVLRHNDVTFWRESFVGALASAGAAP